MTHVWYSDVLAMKITSVQSFLLSYPLETPLKLAFYGGERSIVKRDAMLIRVATDKGLVGYAPGPGSEIAQRSIETAVSPFLEGRTLADPDALRVQFFDQPGCSLEMRKVYCAVEVALYDLASQAQGIPFSELIGGRVRDRIRPLRQRRHVHGAGRRYAEEGRGDRRRWDSALIRCVRAEGPEVDRRNRGAADAEGGWTGFRPDGGRAHLVAHGRPQLQRRNRGPDLARGPRGTTIRAGNIERSRCRPTITKHFAP